MAADEEMCLYCGQEIRDEEVGLDPVERLRRDVRAVAGRLTRRGAGHLVDMYYTQQEHRIATGNQVRTLGQAGEPTELLDHFYEQFAAMEKQIAAALGEYSMSSEVGRWSRAQLGIGPVLAAGLMAHIDIDKAPTVGRIWRFAGLDPTLEWLGTKKATALVAEYVEPGDSPNDDNIIAIAERLHRDPWKIVALARTQDDGEGADPADLTITRSKLISALSRRPYNARLKTLCWKIGHSFVLSKGRENSYYGPLYTQRKAIYVAKNEDRGFRETAARELTERNIVNRELRATYEAGRLPDGRIDLMARRWVEKLFLAHWHDVAYRERHGTAPPRPYPIAHMGHTDYIPPPPG